MKHKRYTMHLSVLTINFIYLVNKLKKNTAWAVLLNLMVLLNFPSCLRRFTRCCRCSACAIFYYIKSYWRYNYNFCLQKALHVSSYSATYFENVPTIRLGKADSTRKFNERDQILSKHGGSMAEKSTWNWERLAPRTVSLVYIRQT